MAAGIFFNAGLTSRAADGTESGSNFTNLIVFAKFSGEEEFVNTVYSGSSVREITDNSFNTAEYSVSDYFKTVSAGKLCINYVYLFDQGGSITLSKSRGYYAAYSENNQEGYKTAQECQSRMYELKLDWSEAINTAIASGAVITNYDGSVTYNKADLDKNHDGKIDAITLIYKNTTQSNISVSRGAPLWNYRDYADYVNITTENGGTLVSWDYVQLTNLYPNSSGELQGHLYQDKNRNLTTSLGTAIHETGHILGLKDLYNTQEKQPVYYMSVMAKHLSPVPQFISVKEQEALGWADAEQLPVLTADGTYSLSASGTQNDGAVIGYKMNIPTKNKTLYLEYRNFEETGNKYDSQVKKFYKADGSQVDAFNLKSGLVCYLAESDIRFPSNINCVAPRWNYEVLGGGNTKNDAALAQGEEKYITDKVCIRVTEVTPDRLKFEISGIGEEHIHTGGEATCVSGPVCEVCQQVYGEINASNHKHTELRGVKEPDSTQEGYTGDLYCTDCQQLIQQGTVIPKKCPDIIEGQDTQIDGNTTEAATFRSNALFADFIRVELDGVELRRDIDYTVESGSIIVRLMPEFLRTLAEGRHSIGIVSDGGTAVTTFNISRVVTPETTQPPEATKTPETAQVPESVRIPVLRKEPTATPKPTEAPEPTATPKPESPQIPATTATPAAESAAADPEQEVSQAGGQAMEQQRAGKAWLVTGGIILCMGIAAGGLWLQHHIVQEKRKNDEG